jgi:hypothetical protein
MDRHAVTVSLPCPRCGATAERDYLACVFENRLRFAASIACPTCSLREEMDGPELTDDARSAFSAAEGRWSMTVDDLGPNPTAALRVLRDLLQVSPAELMRLVRERKARFEGALVEIEHTAMLLEEAGIRVVKIRLSE